MDPQPDLLAGLAPPRRPEISPERRAADFAATARARLHALLGELRAAASNPWSRQRTEVNRLLFAQMSNWLPGEERTALHAQFQDELQRLDMDRSATSA